MLSDSSILKRKDTLIIFTYTNAGFGHLRVSNALSHSMPENINHLYFQTNDKTINFLHRITSIHPVARLLFEWSQKGFQEYIFAYIYKKSLRFSAHKLYERFISVIKFVKTPPKKIIIIATHFSIAHQLVMIRRDLEHKLDCKLYIFVQVTDDSSQYLWYVPGADLIFVPSRLTKEELQRYGKKANLEKTKIKVTPYPISNKLLKKLSDQKYEKRLNQFDSKFINDINILIPISGAAVGMKYFEKFTSVLFKYSNKFNIHYVVKNTSNTQFFIEKLKKTIGVYINSHKRNTKVIEEYENELKNNVFGFEITKPSEQAFKTLISPYQVGGVILLFTNPIGRQEYDNLYFLKRHRLIPSNEDQKYLWDASLKDIKIDEKILKKATGWRGLRLFKDPDKSVKLILWCLKHGVFKQMGSFNQDLNRNSSIRNEIRPDGVYKFWKEIDSYIKNKEKT